MSTEQKKRVWTKEEILALIDENDEMVKRSLLKLYGYQTKDEQETKSTMSLNGIGFNSNDALILSNMAEFLTEKKFLTNKQIEFVRKRIRKYSKQLVKIANNEI